MIGATARFGRGAASLLVAVLLVAGCGGGGGVTPTPTPAPTTPTPVPTATPKPAAPAGVFEYEGADVVSWWYDQYSSSDATASREALAGHGGNWAGLLVTWYMTDKNSTTIAPDSQKTPNEASLTAAIRHLHSLGLKVMLKPHVDVNDGTWRGSILPPDTAGWFASYDAYMTQMARFAEAERVEMLCVGTELARLTGTNFRRDWERVIANVRTNYGGALTYAANGNYAGDEFSSMSFVDLLDLAGVDGYVPLTGKDDPTLDELRAAWSRNRNGEDMLSLFRNWQRSHGRPMIFTEIGYRSANGANRWPWDYSIAGAYDPAEQADCYYTAFSVFLPERAWMRGAFWWSWDISRPGGSDTGYAPWTKPAGELLKERYTATP